MGVVGAGAVALGSVPGPTRSVVDGVGFVAVVVVVEV